MRTVPVRIPKGVHDAVSELAKKRDLDKSAVVSILISAALTQFEGELSETTKALIVADAFEGYSQLYRAWANATKEERKQIKDELGKIMTLTQEFIGVEQE